MAARRILVGLGLVLLRPQSGAAHGEHRSDGSVRHADVRRCSSGRLERMTWMRLPGRVATAAACAAFALNAAAEVYGPADPIPRDASRFDPKRPIRREMQTDVPDGFTVGA